ncbi:LuxR C-terminal-related transcriptional regulator [Azospirillum picis]|uniref:DNA-binding CsgD family transcriptional regulator n=1 Tax=Azospirillum picis TaxID=488438 RepID=A0ABU0MPH2_9PROT|nr:LuxR C-terminal-related transcriptional regulator [Azospirillum picis]MBP2301543.1 DNA-binding CsgD family transcriptional regulator [Azospirillum picis]MDQ0535375.1 DNA-binding CsgD family transcriptional regulator [Azospirillum picis]
MLSQTHSYTTGSVSVHGAKGGGSCHLRDALGGLTMRQREAVELAAAGKTNKEIARALQISEGTAKAHVLDGMTRLGVPRRAMLAPLAADAADHSAIDRLSIRDAAVLALVADGAMDKEIADRLSMNMPVVKLALRRIRRVTGGTRTTAAAAFRAHQRAVMEGR